MKTNPSLILMLLSLPSHGLDISGKVVDKVFVPIAGAKVCAEAAPATCVTTAADGTFHFQGTVRLAPGNRGLRDYRFDFQRGSLTLNAPRAASARLEWFDAGGHSRLAAADLNLASGGNAIAIPAGLQEGLVILRLTAEGATETWKAVWDRRSLSGSPEAAEAPYAVLAKSAAIAGLVASKAGYASSTYAPKADPETGDIIVLGGEGEKVSLMFDGKTLDGWLPSSGKLIGNATGSWVVKNGVLHSMGTVQGTLVSKNDYGNFRMIFKMQQISPSNHWASVLLYGSRTPTMHEFALQAYQFGVPNGHHWDYFHSGNLAGNAYFTTTANSLGKFEPSLCEIVTNIPTGEAKLACCNLKGAVSCKTKEVLRFKNAGDGRVAPIAFQIHNTGLLDEYWDITIEENPSAYEFITAK